MVQLLRNRLRMGRPVRSNGQSGRKIKARVKAEKEVDTRCFNGRSNRTGD